MGDNQTILYHCGSYFVTEEKDARSEKMQVWWESSNPRRREKKKQKMFRFSSDTTREKALDKAIEYINQFKGW